MRTALNEMMRIALTIAILFISVILHAEEITGVTVYEIISQPDKYDNKKIDVMGFASSGFENNVLWVTKDDAKIGNYYAGLWLDMNVDEKYNNKFVQIIGTFNKEGKGHLGLYRGTIVVEKIKLKAVDIGR